MSAKKIGGRDWEDSFYSMEEKYRQLQRQLNDKENELKLVKVKNLKDDLKGNSSRAPLNTSSLSQNVTPSAAKARPQTAGGNSRGGSPMKAATKRPPTRNASMAAKPSNDSPRRFSSQSTTALHISPPATATTKIHQDHEYITDLDELLRRVGGNEQLSAFNLSPHEVTSAGQFRPSHIGVPASAGTGAFTHGAEGYHSQVTGHQAASDQLVDPLMMLWGHNNISAQNNALYQMNTTLKAALEEAQSMLKSSQHDLANQRALSNSLQQQLDEIRIEMSQVVRDRDLSGQKLTNATNTINQQQGLLQLTTDEKEKLRFNLESQLRDLRSRLSSAADNNDALSSDTRTLITELRESSSKVAALQSKLVLLESTHAHQVNVNQTMVVELESLNHQLVNDRKKLLTTARDLQSTRQLAEEKQEADRRISQLSLDKQALEREHLRLLDDMLSLTQSTAAQARGEVRGQIDELSAAAHHWERVSALLYQDISKRTASHVACREECEEAKRLRDEAMAAARSLRQELALASAKLDIIWPNHVKDTKVFEDIDTMKATFERIMKGGYKSDKGARLSGALETFGNDKRTLPSQPADFSFLDNVPAEELVGELQAANAAIFAELEGMRAANDVLSDQLRMAQDTNNAAVLAAKKEVDALKHFDNENHYTLAQQCDRIEFLEGQVALLRGVQVQPTCPIDSLQPTETIAEVFIGQVLSGHGLRSDPANGNNFSTLSDGTVQQTTFPSLFCSVDFLIHETATTGIVCGYQSFFDLVLSYKFTMDSLFIHYLRTRGLRVQLYKLVDGLDGMVGGIDAVANGIPPPPYSQQNYGVGSSGKGSYTLIGEGVISLLDLIANERVLTAQRPQLRGHVRLYDPSMPNVDTEDLTKMDEYHIGSVEYSVTIRTPFSKSFIQQVKRLLAVQPASSAVARASNFSRLVLAPSYGPSSPYAMLEHITSVELEFISMSLPYTIDPLPLLSLYYTIPQVGVEGNIPPAFQVPRYETKFADSDRLAARQQHGYNSSGAAADASMYKRISPKESFLVEASTPNHIVKILTNHGTDKSGSLDTSSQLYAYKLSKVLAEPVPIVAFDEHDPQVLNSSNRSSSSVHYWSLGLLNWEGVLDAAAKYLVNDPKASYSQIMKIPMQTAEGEAVGTITVRVSLNGSEGHSSLASRSPLDHNHTGLPMPQPELRRLSSSASTGTARNGATSPLSAPSPMTGQTSENISNIRADIVTTPTTPALGDRYGSMEGSPSSPLKDEAQSVRPRPPPAIQQSIYSSNTSITTPNVSIGAVAQDARSPSRLEGLSGVLAGLGRKPAAPPTTMRPNNSDRGRLQQMSNNNSLEAPSTIGTVPDTSILL